MVEGSALVTGDFAADGDEKDFISDNDSDYEFDLDESNVFTKLLSEEFRSL